MYAPGIVTIDKDDEQQKTYFPIIGDNINKVTRDIEFTNTQETGLSTSKSKIYPKIVPLTSSTTPTGFSVNSAKSIISDKDIIDVISVGTAKEQDLKDDNNQGFSFIYETNKNPLIAQIPYNDSSINIGQDITEGFKGNEYTFAASNDNKLLSGNTVLSLAATNVAIFTSGTPVVDIGDYLNGENKNLVKITAISGGANDATITCDGEISSKYVETAGSTGNKIYNHRYGFQDRLAVFETKPFESALDIYYETSTAGYVHELNEAVSTVTDIKSVEFNDTQDFKESTIFYNDNGDFQNIFAATLEIKDLNDNILTLGNNIGQISAGGIEILEERGTGPNETSSLFS